eukprot:s3825_g5.t1
MGTGVLNSGLLAGPPHVGKRSTCPSEPAGASVPTPRPLRKSFLGAVTQDVQAVIVLELLGGPQPVARMAVTCREMLKQLRDPRSHQLRVSTASFCAVTPALLALSTGDCRRSHVNTLDGTDIPIGFFQGAWESAYLTSDIARILVEEVLGYHTWIHPEDGRSAVTTPYAPAGCLDFNNAINQQCGINETRLHVCVDCRSSSYASVVEDMKDTFPH